MKQMFLLMTMLVLFGASAAAQDDKNNEVGLLLGVEFVPDSNLALAPGGPVAIGNSEVFQVNFARKLLTREKAELWLEFPAAAGPSHSIRNADPATPTSVATFYLTPSLRVMFAPRRKVSPWLSFGGGYSLFETSESYANGAKNADRLTHSAALQIGGGVDIKTPIKVLVPVTLRAELRDFYSFDAQRINARLDRTGQHGVVASGGIVLRW